jgi:hypothetical protein
MLASTDTLCCRWSLLLNCPFFAPVDAVFPLSVAHGYICWHGSILNFCENLSGNVFSIRVPWGSGSYTNIVSRCGRQRFYQMISVLGASQSLRVSSSTFPSRRRPLLLLLCQKHFTPILVPP